MIPCGPSCSRLWRYVRSSTALIQRLYGPDEDHVRVSKCPRRGNSGATTAGVDDRRHVDERDYRARTCDKPHTPCPHGLMTTRVPFGTARQISSISSLVT